MDRNSRAASGRPCITAAEGAAQNYWHGRLPLDWFSAAAHLPGKSLHIAIAVWCLAVGQKSSLVKLSNKVSMRFGADRSAKYRGLAWLERAGLIKVERQLGRAPVVTILDERGDL